MSVRFRSGMSRGVGSLLLVVSIAVLAAVAFGVDAGSAKMSRATACGGVPNLPPNDPNNLLPPLKLTKALQHDYTGWKQPIMKSQWSNWKPKGQGAVQGRDRLVGPVELVERLHVQADAEVAQAEPARRQEHHRDDGLLADGGGGAGTAVQRGGPAGRRHHPDQCNLADGDEPVDRGGREARDPDGLRDQHRQFSGRSEHLAEYVPRRFGHR